MAGSWSTIWLRFTPGLCLDRDRGLRSGVQGITPGLQFALEDIGWTRGNGLGVRR
jgi:hypothetical protein